MSETPAAPLDKIDRKILRLLQKDGRMSNVDIAKAANLSAATAYRRTQRLFDEGFVKGVHAHIDPKAVERGVLVMVGVVLDRSTPESFAEFEKEIKTLPFVLDCYLVAGEFDYLLKIRVKNLDGFNRIHSSKLIAIPNVRQARTFFVLKDVIDGQPLDF